MTQIILRSTEREIVLRGDADARSGWTFSDLIDWWGLSDNKLGARERPQAHGAFQSSRSLRSSKAISFNARFLAATPQAAEAAIDDLGGLGSDGPVLMIVTAPSGSTQRSVSIDAVTRLISVRSTTAPSPWTCSPPIPAATTWRPRRRSRRPQSPARAGYGQRFGPRLARWRIHRSDHADQRRSGAFGSRSSSRVGSTQP